MKLKILMLMLGGGLFCSPAEAFLDSNKTSLSMLKASQENESKQHLKRLKNVHNYNEIFDNPTAGGLPYEETQKTNGEKR